MTGVDTGCIFDSGLRVNRYHLSDSNRRLIPSIRYSLQISHSFFITASGRYLFCMAFSSHSSTSACLLNLAGPGLGTFFESDIVLKYLERVEHCGSREFQLRYDACLCRLLQGKSRSPQILGGCFCALYVLIRRTAYRILSLHPVIFHLDRIPTIWSAMRITQALRGKRSAWKGMWSSQ